MKNDQYHATKIKPLINIVASIVASNPGIIDEPDFLLAQVAAKIPDFHDRSKCINCGASMAEYIFEFDVLDALLLYEMGKLVRERVQEMGPTHFTDANKIRTPDMMATSLAVKCRTTQCSKLGLIAKYRTSTGRHVPGTWVITKRGFEALRGLPVPRQVRVFRGEILERTADTVTIDQAFQLHHHKVMAKIKNGKKVKTDYRDDIKDYQPNEWIHIAGMHQGDII